MNAPPLQEVTFAEAFRFWLKLGFISFGGPAGQISIMHQELVERRRWISEKRFLHALNYCMVLPGPEAQQLATYIGWLMHRTWGGIVAGGLFVLPSLAILIALSWVYVAYGNLPAVAGLFYGVKPAVTAIVLFAAWRIGKRSLKSPALWAIAFAAFVAIAWLAAPFPAILAAAAMLGWLGERLRPRWFAATGAHSEGQAAHGPVLIDDLTPPPAHARFARARLVRVLLAGAVLWGAPLALLAMSDANLLVQMGWFFTKAALLTFGGAYAVLPYVQQAAVEHYGWLGAGQMIDGLALGETTPGPLIMVVAFVGFVGAGAREALSPQAMLAAGAMGAAVATWFTFLPSFLFILAGGPLVESTRDTPHLAAPLNAVTAAVVGVIVNLALTFARHVLWPLGWGEAPDAWALAIFGAALVALFRFGVGVIPVVGGSALAGLVLTLAN